jgi:ADP-ribose pyrophosphatase YjhB (NUDIX family)
VFDGDRPAKWGYNLVMKFCSTCGEPVELKVPTGDNRERFVCNSCATIHYQNPRIITGCLPVWNDQVLMCKRAIDPRRGYWTLPAGFLENGESIAAGAARETEEEANARVYELELYTVFSLPHISQAYMFFRAMLEDLDFSAGFESLEVRLFTEHEVPWDELAFPVIKQSLEFYFEDRKNGSFPVRSREIDLKRKR